ncbi:MAG: hypothetical protein KDI36_09330 [Pseudomonadales bacterium]|nr:hypothetical protein [Pseudomonadales bacterium]
MSVDIPWFEDFERGQDFSAVPAVTITAGHTAIHQAMFGDRFPLPLSEPLCQQVTGEKGCLVNASLVCNLAIGQTTIPSQRVMGNLFYRGLVLKSPVYVGDTLSTRTTVVGLRQNSLKPGREASGMVALEMHVTNQRAETVLLFWRCPMIPCRDPAAQTGHADDFGFMPSEISLADLSAAVPDWKYEVYRDQVRGRHFADLRIGEQARVESRDTVTLAPELVRMTLNMAMTHTDATRSVYNRRLVYGGHTISMVASHLSRQFPAMMTILGWFHCDHVAPVFEEDIIETEVVIADKLPQANGGIVVLQVNGFALRDEERVKVLDWKLAALFA